MIDALEIIKSTHAASNDIVKEVIQNQKKQGECSKIVLDCVNVLVDKVIRIEGGESNLQKPEEKEKNKLN
jgi:3-phenylpropionate/cinnamic acid dioxygenase small subunit